MASKYELFRAGDQVVFLDPGCTAAKGLPGPLTVLETLDVPHVKCDCGVPPDYADVGLHYGHCCVERHRGLEYIASHPQWLVLAKPDGSVVKHPFSACPSHFSGFYFTQAINN